uniref:Phage tail protein, P2 protein I family n=1 Tax=Candidatus Kentrum sp. LFY TaxID=2126342 RepID=A0A450WGU3_9GAMM|nr:MAG: phage tail protein, P2 protein I family [Candidatus Kentron sp. LFY]
MMSDLLIPPLAPNDRIKALDALSARMTGLDLTPILVYLIDLVPAEALPYLAEQFNVTGPLWDYLPNDAARRRAIRGSVAWHRAKGTPWSIEEVLSWAGYRVKKVEDTTSPADLWAQYQLELGVPVDGKALDEVLTLARFAAPARAHLVRLYGGFDRRMMRASTGSRWSHCYASDHSGVRIGGVQLSFGRTWHLVVERDWESETAVSVHRLHHLTATRASVMRWGFFRYGDTPEIHHKVIHQRTHFLANAEGMRDPAILADDIPSRPWAGEYDGSAFISAHRRIHKASVVASGGAPIGDIDARFGIEGIRVAKNRFFWSDPESRVSDFDPGWVDVPLDQVSSRIHAMSARAHWTPSLEDAMLRRTHFLYADGRGPVLVSGNLRWSGAPISRIACSIVLHRTHVSHAERPALASRYGWTGDWDQRRWNGDVAFEHQTTEEN